MNHYTDHDVVRPYEYDSEVNPDPEAGRSWEDDEDIAQASYEAWCGLIEPTVVHLESVYDKWAEPSDLAKRLDRLYPIYEPLNDDEPF